MAKQRNEHDQPRPGDDENKQKSPPPPPDDVEEVIELAEAEIEQQPAAPPDPKKTRVARRAASPTMIGKDDDDESPDEAAAAEPTPAVPNLSIDEPEEVIEVEPVSAVVEAAPASDIVEAAPASGVVLEAEAVPASGTARADSDVFVAEAAPASEVFEAKPASAATPGSDVFAADLAEAEPAGSDVAAAQPASSAVFEAAPASEVKAEGQADDIDLLDLAEASATDADKEPGSSVFEAEPVAAEAASSAVLAAEAADAEEVVEAAPGSSVFDAEVASDAAPEAKPVSSDLFDVGPASDKAALAEELPLESIVPSSATARAEDAIGREELSDEGAPIIQKKTRATADEAEVLDAAEAAPAATGSSAINWDEVGEGSSAAKKSTNDEATVAFDPKAQAKSKSLSDAEKTEGLVSFDDLDEKGSSVSLSGIEPAAEALESGVGLSEAASAAQEPSVEFDDLVDDDEKKPSPKKGKKGKQDSVLDLVDDDAPKAKKGKKPAKKLDDDDEEEIAAAAALADDDDAEAAAAAALTDDDDEGIVSSKTGADDDEALAALSTDDDEEETPRRKTKQVRKTAALDDEEAATADDEEEAPKKKKGKKPELVAAGKRPSLAVRWLGGMFLGALFAVGGAAAVWYFAPQLLDEIPASPNATAKKQQGPPVAQATPLQKAAAAIAEGEYAQALELLPTETTDPAELSARGEARWLKYVKEHAKDGAFKRESPDVQAALKDVKTAKNEALLAQIDHALEAGRLRADVAKLGNAAKQLVAVQDVLAKAGVAAKVEELPKVVAQTLAQKQFSEKLLGGVGTALEDAKLIADKSKLDLPGFQKLVKDVAEQQVALTAVNKLLEDAKIKSGAAKGVKEVLDARKDVEEKLADVNKLLEGAKVKAPGAKGVQELAEARAKLQKDRDAADAALNAAVKELTDAKILPPGAEPRKGIVEGAKLARIKAESPLAIPLSELGAAFGSVGGGVSRLVNAAADMSATAAELGYYRLREPFVLTPLQKLDWRIALLRDRGRNNPKDLAAALNEAAWVRSKESGAPPTAKAKALYAEGLALRNQEKYDAARKALRQAVTEAETAKAAGPWVALAKQSLAELTDPSVYFVPRIAKSSDPKEALSETDTALKVLPGDSRLLLERAKVRLEQARTLGKVSPEAEKDIRADVEAAQKGAKALSEATFVLGELEEQLRHYDVAEKLYRAALKELLATKGPLEAGYRYRIALARVLQQERSAAAEVPPAIPEEKKADEKKADEKKKDEKKKADEVKVGRGPAPLHPLALLVLQASIGAQPGAEDDIEDPVAAARIRESLSLAEELIKSTDAKVRGQGYVLKGKALSLQGKRTEGLKEYVRGMQLLHPDLSSKELSKLLAEHPAFQHPDIAKVENPLLAEKHYGAGLHAYWSGKYGEAEAQFKQAIGFYGHDARYMYYMGLAQLAQRTKLKRDAAYYSFEQGARLEAKNQPPTLDVNAGLERVQGPLRSFLDRFRFRTEPAAMTPPAAPKAS